MKELVAVVKKQMKIRKPIITEARFSHLQWLFGIFLESREMVRRVDSPYSQGK